MRVNIENFEKCFDSASMYDLSLTPADWDVGGGRMTKEELDIIKEHPEARSIELSGLNQETFEYFISNYGNQFEAMAFHKNKMVSDLSLFADLHNLKYLYYFFNQRATDLWDMTANVNLEGLAIYDFSRLTQIDRITTAPKLKYFSIGNMVWSKSKIQSIKPVVNTNITHFAWSGDKVEDKDFLCLANSKLEMLDINICRFKLEELAELVASIPNLKENSIKPYREGSIMEKGVITTYYYLCKGKKTLQKGQDDDKLAKYLAEFEGLVEKYRKEKA